MYEFGRAIAFTAIMAISLLVASKPGMSQTHNGHHPSASPPATVESRESDRITESFVNDGLTKLHQKNYNSAIESFSKAVEMQSNHYLAFTYRADVYRLLKNYPAAIDDYTKAIKLNPTHSYLRNSRGNCYAALGDYISAIEDHTQAISIYPEEGAGYRYRGIVYTKVGENEKAMEDLNSAISRNETDAEAYLTRGEVYAKLKNPENAIADYQQAARIFSAQSNLEGYTRAVNFARLLPPQLTPANSK